MGYFGGFTQSQTAAMRDESGPSVAHSDPQGIHRQDLTLFGDGVEIAEQDSVVVACMGRPTEGGEWLAERTGTRLLALYRESGPDFVARIGGSFAIMVRDTGADLTLIALDKIGQKHICYALVEDLFVFGTDADLVLRHRSVDREISEQGLFDYLYFHHCPSPGSIYKNVAKLRGGEYLVKRGSNIDLKRYWQPAFSEHSELSLEEMSHQLKSTLSRATSRLVDDAQTTGAFLSGGLDSSSVTGFFAGSFDEPVKTFSMGFPVEGYDELEYAQAAVSEFSTIPHEYYITPEDVVDAVPLIAAHYDEPFGNSSALPTYFCAKLALDSGVSTLLAGDAGDELFAGNERYTQQLVFERYKRVPKTVRSALEYASRSMPAPLSRRWLFHKTARYIEQANTPLPDRLQDANFLTRTPANQIFSEDLLAAVDVSSPLNLQRDEYNLIDDASDINRMLYLDWKMTLHDNDLVKVNRMCDLVGVDVRYPMLDDDLVSLSCSIPTATKLMGGELRGFYKYSMKGFLPDKIINKSKHGFGLPFGIWLSDHKPLKEMAYDSITNLGKRGFFRPEFLDRSVEMHRSEHAAYYGELIWILMMLELWLQSHIDAK